MFLLFRWFGPVLRCIWRTQFRACTPTARMWVSAVEGFGIWVFALLCVSGIDYTLHQSSHMQRALYNFGRLILAPTFGTSLSPIIEAVCIAFPGVLLAVARFEKRLARSPGKTYCRKCRRVLCGLSEARCPACAEPL